MRFSSLLALMAPIAMLSSASAAGLPNNIPRTTLTERAITAPICASVNLGTINLVTLTSQVLGTTLGAVVGTALGILNPRVNLGDLCLCATATALSPQSLLNIDTALQTNTPTSVLGIVSGLVGDVVSIVAPLSLRTINQPTTVPTCSSTDPNVVPSATGAQCNVCTYSCRDGYEYCNDVCVVKGSACATVDMGRKRSVKERSRYACPQPLTACPVSHFLARETAATYGGGFECIDTTSNLESCGGCATPFRGSVAGEDCTAIANVDSVSCTSGRCIVDSCAPGFVPSADSSVCEQASRFSSSRLTVQGRSRRK